MSFLIPSSAAILRPASKPSYSVVLLVACSLGKCIWTMYLRCSPVGAISSTPAPAPSSEKAPSKYISQSLLASLPGMLVSGISSSGVGVHSAMNSANALLWMVEVLSNPLDNPACCFGILQYPLKRKASDHCDLVCLEVMAQLSRGHEEAEKQLLHTRVPRSSPLQEGTDEVNWALHHFLLLHLPLRLHGSILVGARACWGSPSLVIGRACRGRWLVIGLPLRY